MIWLMIAGFFGLVLLGVPIAFAMGVAALTYILVEGIPLTVVAQRFFSDTQSFAFLAIPFFILMGNLMVEGKIAERIIDFAGTLVRHFPGGLACVDVVTSMGMAGVSGSSVADAASTGSVLIPEMKRHGYSASFAGTINASSAVVGIIIPPSSTMIIMAWLANISVASMFLAGILPGILIGLAYLALTVVISKRRGYPREPRARFGELLRAIQRALWALALPVLLIYVIVAGVATATEAAAVAAIYAFLVATFVYRSLDLRGVVRALKASVYGTTVVMVLVASASLFTWVLISENVPRMLSDVILGLGLADWAVILMLVLIMAAAGMVMDLVPNLFIFIPIFFPIATGAGMDPLHFSLVMLCALALGLFTPPVGTTLFISCYLAGIGIEDIYRDLIPYFLVGVAVVILITYVPALSLAIPTALGQ